MNFLEDLLVEIAMLETRSIMSNTTKKKLIDLRFPREIHVYYHRKKAYPFSCENEKGC